MNIKNFRSAYHEIMFRNVDMMKAQSEEYGKIFHEETRELVRFFQKVDAPRVS